MTKNLDKLLTQAQQKEKKIETFSDILDGLHGTADKKKLLWKEIYENALIDRENASILFTDLLLHTKGDATSHVMCGTIMSKYLERMSKSNDQILRLAEIIQKAEQENTTIDPDEIFDQIGA